jgi:hypothetical protein
MNVPEFSGSYDPQEVLFLLKKVRQEVIPVEEKEAHIQSGARHYSEMIGPEHTPTAAYLAAFDAAVAANGDRLARDVLALAAHLAQTRDPGRPIWLASLARAGTPIGVLLLRALRGRWGRAARHVSLSIISGRGVDANALDALRGPLGARDEDIVFVDGWTGKGVIARELQRAVAAYNAARGARLSSALYVVADLCGHATAATTEDYLIPSCLLGATVSGLVSRTMIPGPEAQPSDFHGCRYYEELAAMDRSRAFVDEVSARMEGAAQPGPLPARCLATEAVIAAAAVERWREAGGLSSPSYVKPGVGEATRVLLRRAPRQLVIQGWDNPELGATLLLAREKGVPVVVDPSLPWSALALIDERRP